MKDKRSLHLKVQEHCDCFTTTDPLKQMSLLAKDDQTEEAALKWVALAVLHGINRNAKKVTLARETDGSVTVTAKYRKTHLPSPGAEIGAKVVDSIRKLAHFDSEEGKTSLALGVRDSSLAQRQGTVPRTESYWDRIHALEVDFQRGLAQGDGNGADNALLELDRIIWQARAE